MPDTVMAEETYISKVDSFQDRYLIEYPASMSSDLIVFYLHGGLSHAEQGFCDEYQWCFKKLGDEVIRRGGVYVSPEYRGDSWMNEATETDMKALITSLKERFEASKVIITGGSMGGTSALILASHHNDIINGVIALCPATDMSALYHDLRAREGLIFKHLTNEVAVAYGGTPEEVPQEYYYRSSIKHTECLKMPVVICHGDADRIVPVSHSRAIVDALKTQKSPVLYDEITGGDHNAPTIETPWKKYLDFVLEK